MAALSPGDDVMVLGANQKNLGELARIMVHALSEGVPSLTKKRALVTDETGAQMVTLLKQLQGALPAEQFAKAAQGLNETQQKMVQALLSQ